MKKFNFKNKTSIYIGRFQPFHAGHKALFKKVFKLRKQVMILVMDSQGINRKNPFSFEYVKKKIENSLSEYKGYFKIKKIPVVGEVVYGRKVGYKIKKINLGKEIEKISATEIRNLMNKR